MDTKLSVLTWGLLCRWLRAVSLKVMGSLGCKVYDALDTAEHVLLGELDSLLDSVDQSHCDGRLSTVISSSVPGGVSTGQGPVGNSNCWGVVITQGEGSMEDWCQK